MVMRYAVELNSRVQARLIVPEGVQMMHLSGKTVVAIRVAPDGSLLGASVAHSSGAGPIDRAALATVRATRLPPFGPGMPDHPVTFDLTVRIKN
jgi:protein TonB